MLLFARELAQTGKLESFGAGNDYFEDILSDPSEDFAHYEARYGGIRAALCEEALDFILFVKARHADEQTLWAEVERTRAYRAQHPEEVIMATADELDL